MSEYSTPWGVLGWITYKRTYARWDDLKQRNEEFHETLKRVVEGNINLDPRLKQKRVPKKVREELQKEAEELFIAFYTLKALPPGRGLWISGTDFADKHGDALNNCWFVSVRPQKYGDSKIVPYYADKDKELVSLPFSFLFDQSMKGGGVGFSVSKHFQLVPNGIDSIPEVKKPIELEVRTSEDDPIFNDEDLTLVSIMQPIHVDSEVFRVPDSREGWVEALALVIDAHFGEIESNKIIINVEDIRPEGARIKGFGGIASGSKPLIKLFEAVNDLLNQRVGEKLSAVDLTDIMNLIGKTVVAGNVRRSAEIALGDSDDNDFITMKQDKEKLTSHRWASNNTIIIDNEFDNYNPMAEAVAVNGEPGMGNIYLARNYGRIADGFNPEADSYVEGWNPCGEVALENMEMCNLVELFPAKVATDEELYKIAELAVRYAKRVTFSNYDWEGTRKVAERNRRIGISLSGIQNWFVERFGTGAVVNWDFGITNEGTTYNKPVYNPLIVSALDRLYNTVKQSDQKYSAELGCNESIKTTTVKPSGTVALLPGVSPGIHWDYSDVYIRRIRFQKNDPLVEILKEGGYHIEDDVYSDNTVVVNFYVKAKTAGEPGFKSASEVSIEEQIANQALIQTYWADNAVSCTITFKEDEAHKIGKLLKVYKNYIKSTSFLPYSGHGFEQAPYEPITAEEFDVLMEKIKGTPEELATGNVDSKGAELEGIDECSGGVCPIK